MQAGAVQIKKLDVFQDARNEGNTTWFFCKMGWGSANQFTIVGSQGFWRGKRTHCPLLLGGRRRCGQGVGEEGIREDGQHRELGGIM